MTAEYSLHAYSQMCSQIIEFGYRTVGFSFTRDYGNGLSRQTEPLCLMRHDVDADPDAARDLAVLEGSLGVTATYFLMTRSPIYNLFSRHSHRMVSEIIANGHEIGLHYDHGFDLREKLGAENICRRVMRDVELLEDEYLPTSFSEIPIVNTYDQELMNRFRYLSDSNRTFPTDQFNQCLRDQEAMQVLTHPMWWVYGGVSDLEVWTSVLTNQIRRAESQLLETERTYSRPCTIRIDHEGRAPGCAPS